MLRLILDDRESRAIYGMIREGRYAEADAAICSALHELDQVEAVSGWSRIPPHEMRDRLAGLRTLLERLERER
jgi:hypothetical protein